jgi:hypothetical protein
MRERARLRPGYLSHNSRSHRSLINIAVFAAIWPLFWAKLAR